LSALRDEIEVSSARLRKMEQTLWSVKKEMVSTQRTIRSDIEALKKDVDSTLHSIDTDVEAIRNQIEKGSNVKAPSKVDKGEISAKSLSAEEAEFIHQTEETAAAVQAVMTAISGDVATLDEDKVSKAIANLAATMTKNANVKLAATGMDTQRIAQWWLGNGHIGTERAQHMDYVKEMLSLGPGIKHICEVGLNAGHSAAIFLAVTAQHDAVYHSLDILEHVYSSSTIKLLKAVFGKRFALYPGDSAKTMVNSPDLKKCQIWSLDGNHGDGAVNDIRTALRISPDLKLIMTDDLTDPTTTPQAQARGCTTNIDAWTKAVSVSGGELVTKGCVLADKNKENGNSPWCSAWCFGTPDRTAVKRL